MKYINNTIRKMKSGATKASALMLSAFCTVDAYAQIPTINGPGGANGSDPFNLVKEIIKWSITFVGYGLCVLVFLSVVKNTWAKYNDMGEEGSRTTWREVLTQGIGGLVIVVVGVVFVRLAIGVFGEATI